MSDVDLKDSTRKAQVGGPYLEVEFPDFFRIDCLTRSGSWLEWGAYFSENVHPREDGSFILASEGSDFFIRCIADHEDFIVHVDGGGEGQIFYYRIVPLPDPREPGSSDRTDRG